MIESRRAQLSFGDGLIAEEVTDLWDDWMHPADQVLDDDQLLSTVYEALTKRRPKSRTRGRKGTPAEVVLRLLLLKHIRNWSYEVVEREVRANLVYRSFTRVGGGKVPDDTVMNKWAIVTTLLWRFSITSGPRASDHLFMTVSSGTLPPPTRVKER